MEKKLSEKIINRLTLYHYILQEYLLEHKEFISSPQIANLLKIDDSQVRKDISILKNIGKSRVGYNVEELKKSIERNLGFKNPKNVFVIGAGNLGFALAKYSNFTNYGLNVLALFDNDISKAGTKINNKQIYHISKLEEMTKKLNVDIAILTVPREHSQNVADLLVKTGFNYIWNFTPTVLSVPNHIQICNENLIGNFLNFTLNK